jgi:hypothetical protein
LPFPDFFVILNSENMRPKFVLGILLLAVGVAIGAVLLKHLLAPAPLITVASVSAPAQTPSAPAPLPPPAPFSAPPPAPLTADQQEATNQAEIDLLQEWSRNDDPQSLSNILADLSSPQKDVREAAIEAAKQFGSTNAIPALKAAALNATDTDEQIEMLQAANFLTLPSISSIQLTPDQIAAGQQRAAKMQAERQARMQAAQQQQAQPQGQAQGANQPPAPQQSPQQ